MADDARLRLLRLRQAQERARTQMTHAAPPSAAPPPAASPPPSGPATSMVEQGTSGMNEGAAFMLGLPGDMLRRGLDAVGIPLAENPTIGGMEIPLVSSSEYWRKVLGPTISETPPQTMPQRIARRVGQDVGAGAVAAPVAGLASLGGLALNTAADAASGLAGGLTAEVTDDPTIQMIASLLAGGGTVAASRAARPGPAVPSMDDLRAVQRNAYDTVNSSTATLTPQATQDLTDNINARLRAENADQYLHPRATRTAERLGEMDQPTLLQVEQGRRLVGRDVAGSADAGERALGQAMKDEIDTYLDKLQPGQVQGSGVQDVVDALHTGRATTRKIKKAEQIDNAVYRAENRAATSGTGGNEINAMRQNIRAILDDPRKRRGYSAAEIEAMEAIVRGDATTNTLRQIGRFSPTAGALPMFLSGGAAAGVGFGANPLLAAPSAVGWVAKALGERLTDKQIRELSAMVRNGGPVGPKALSDAERRVLNALMMSEGAQAVSQ